MNQTDEQYEEIAKRDFERRIYAECDKEDREQNEKDEKEFLKKIKENKMDHMEEKYYEDISFRALVDMLFHLICSNKYKAYEILDAAEMAYLKNQTKLNLKEKLNTPSN